MGFRAAEQEAETHQPYVSYGVDIRAARETRIKPLLPLPPCPTNDELPPAKYFQYRPELQTLHDFWRQEDLWGVLALIGMGGAGKTALTHRFLAQVPGSEVEVGGVAKDDSLPTPDARFVWSFHTHPDPRACAPALYDYLMGKRKLKATFEDVQEVLRKDWRGCRILLVFDSVDELQVVPGIEPDKESGTFGQFPEGSSLGRFLAWVCDAPRPVRIIITSRFGLTELERYTTGGSYRAVPIEGLPHESARGLLRAGLKRNDVLDWQLDALVREFGNHAQTLDLLGNALRLFCNSDPARVHDLPSLEDVRHLAEVRGQALSRVRVLRFYEPAIVQPSPSIHFWAEGQ